MQSLIERLRSLVHPPRDPDPADPDGHQAALQEVESRDEQLAAARDEFRRQLAVLQDTMRQDTIRGAKHGTNGFGH